MKYKVLFISSWFPNKIEPTNGNFVQRHAEAVALLHEVEILHTIGIFNQKENYIFDEKRINGIKTLIVYYKNSKNPIQNFYRRMNSYIKGFSQMQKPDVVHANILHNSMLFAVYLKKKLKIPFVVSEHWSALKVENKNSTSFFTKKMAKFIGNQAEKIMPVSENLMIGLKDLGLKIPMIVIPNVVDVDLFYPETKSAKSFTFIHVSNLTHNKNGTKILNVAAKLLKKGYDFKLQIGGDGDISLLSDCVKTENLQSSVEVFGIQTLSQIAQRMRASDCFILFSNYENQPCVIAESFASGIQVISTNVGGVSEFFPDNFGILLEKPDESLLEEAMLKILSNERNYNSTQIKEYAENTFSKEVVARQISSIYNEVLA